MFKHSRNNKVLSVRTEIIAVSLTNGFSGFPYMLFTIPIHFQVVCKTRQHKCIKKRRKNKITCEVSWKSPKDVDYCSISELAIYSQSVHLFCHAPIESTTINLNRLIALRLSTREKSVRSMHWTLEIHANVRDDRETPLNQTTFRIA